MIPLGWEPGRARPGALPGLLNPDRRNRNYIMCEKEQNEAEHSETGNNTEKKDVKPAKKKRGSKVLTLLLVLIILTGVGIMAYPSISDWWNSYHQSQSIADYVTAVNETDPKLLARMIADAREYNAKLLNKENRYSLTDEEMEEYLSLLDLSGTGIIGYIKIDSIGVYLPVYHTTDESLLQVAIGHLEWSSLPVGGESTHSLLSGHRGLPSAKLFTDLDLLHEGETFTVTVLNETLTYRIDQILIVEPNEVSSLSIVPGEDYCTLITCTPYGINTHRILVRGTRIETEEEKNAVIIVPEAVRIPNYIAIPAVAVPILFLLLLFSMFVMPRKRKDMTDEEILESIKRDNIE